MRQVTIASLNVRVENIVISTSLFIEHRIDSSCFTLLVYGTLMRAHF